MRDPPECTPGPQSRPRLLPSAPSLLLEKAGLGGGAGLGAGPHPLAARRLDDRNKMATLEDGLWDSDPGALSPAQLEQLRNFKVGAPPFSPVPKCCPRPQDKGPDRVEGPERREPVPDKGARGLWGDP